MFFLCFFFRKENYSRHRNVKNGFLCALFSRQNIATSTPPPLSYKLWTSGGYRRKAKKKNIDRLFKKIINKTARNSEAERRKKKTSKTIIISWECDHWTVFILWMNCCLDVNSCQMRFYDKSGQQFRSHVSAVYGMHRKRILCHVFLFFSSFTFIYLSCRQPTARWQSNGFNFHTLSQSQFHWLYSVSEVVWCRSNVARNSFAWLVHFDDADVECKCRSMQRMKTKTKILIYVLLH